MYGMEYVHNSIIEKIARCYQFVKMYIDIYT